MTTIENTFKKPDNTYRNLTLFSGIILASLLTFYIWPTNYPLDDAYITQHSARSLWDWHDSKYGTPALSGVTSPLHAALIFASSLILPLWIAQVAIALFSFLLFNLACYEMGILAGLRSIQAMLIAILAMASGPIIFQFSNGLETGLAITALSWTLIAFSKREPSPYWYSLLWALPFIRPELIIVSIFFTLQSIYHKKDNIGALCKPFIFSLLIALPVFLLTWANTGNYFPATINAKKIFFNEACQPFQAKIKLESLGVFAFLKTIGIFAFGVCGVLLLKQRIVFLFFTASLLTSFLLNLPGGVWHNGFRYLFILTPFLVLGIAAIFKKLPLSTKTSTVLLLLSVIVCSTSIPNSYKGYSAGVEQVHDLSEIASWLEKRTDEGDTILVHDAGYISLFGNYRLVDIVGLKTPSSIEIHQRLTTPICNMRNALAIDEIARRPPPQYVIVSEDWDRIFGISRSLEMTNWKLSTVNDVAGLKYKLFKVNNSQATPWQDKDQPNFN
ncbi:hypothetical protein [uncultured Pseudomonas sp.]|uniref:hypothetical protein n=1 Tax=uncultured Pseudomonas sp. TaxID=114707 RepID=UPI0025CCA06A|nr:hypothetical protein [uncultured Pseudomonas sp.]